MLDLALPLLFGLTTMTAMVGLFGDDHNPQDEDGERGTEPPIEGGTSESEFVELGPDHRGSFVGAGDSEQITVRAETSFRTAHLYDKYEEEMSSPLNVRGGGGDDVLILNGCGYVVYGDEGADTIELRGASNVAVFAGSDDTVMGGSGYGNYVELTDNAHFIGAAGSDFVVSSSTAAAHMGAGNDVFIGTRSPIGIGNVTSLVYGGEGDDYLIGSVREENLWWEHADESGFISTDSDSLSGDAGNDTIIGSHGDFMAGGLGNDLFVIVSGNDPFAQGVKVTDFVQGVDQIEIRYEVENGCEDTLSEGAALSYHDFHSISGSEDGFTIYSSGGQVIVNFPAVDSLVVGFQLSANTSSAGSVVDLEGKSISLDECDVIIRGFNSTSL